MSTKRPRTSDAPAVAAPTAAAAAAAGGSAEKKARTGAVGAPPSTVNKGAATAVPVRGSAAAAPGKKAPTTAAADKQTLAAAAAAAAASGKPASNSAPTSGLGGARRPAGNAAPVAPGNGRAPVAFKVAPSAKPPVKPLPPITSFAAETDEGGTEDQIAAGGGGGGSDDGGDGGDGSDDLDLVRDDDERLPTDPSDAGDSGADQTVEETAPAPAPTRAPGRTSGAPAVASAPKKTSGAASSAPRPAPSAKPSVGNRSGAPASSLSSPSSSTAAAPAASAPKKPATGKLALARSRPSTVAPEEIKAPDDVDQAQGRAPSDATDGGTDLDAGSGGNGGGSGGDGGDDAVTVNPDGEFPVDLAQDLGLDRDGESATQAPPSPVVAPAPKKPGVAAGQKAATAVSASGAKLVAPPAATPKTKTAPVTAGGATGAAASKPTGNAKPSNTIAATDASLRRSGIAVGTGGGGGGGGTASPTSGSNTRHGGGGGGNGTAVKGANSGKVGGGGRAAAAPTTTAAAVTAAPKKPASQKPAEAKKAPPRLEVPFGIYRHYKRAAYEREIDATKLANGPEWAAQLSPEQQMEEAGRYYYKVIDVANHTEQRGERLVIYRPLYKSFVYTHGRESDARPIEIFLGDVTVPAAAAEPTEDGAETSEIQVPRFERVPDEDAQGLEEIYAYLYSADATDGAASSG